MSCELEERGRVQIRAYRGPEDPVHKFAPWGYYIEIPADD